MPHSERASPQPQTALPFWLVNVPKDRWPASCPEFLRDVPLKNQQTLATPDQQFHRHSWEDVQNLISKSDSLLMSDYGDMDVLQQAPTFCPLTVHSMSAETNRLDVFQRVPSDLRRYLEYMDKLKREYGSIMRFVLNERLHWTDLEPRGAPFAYEEDYKILQNDWPYGLDENIVHLVIWVKFAIEDDPITDDLTPNMRERIDKFVDEKFRSKMPGDRVVWFRNWKSIKSVHAVEHFHIMLYKPEPEFVNEITNNDIPLVAKVKV